MRHKTKSLDEEEKDLIQEWEHAFERGEAKEKPFTKREKESLRHAAILAVAQSKAKDKRLTIRVNGPVLDAIKDKAAKKKSGKDTAAKKSKKKPVDSE